MRPEDDFRLRPGPIRGRGEQGRHTFVGEALAAAEKAGGLAQAHSRAGRGFGRGRAASLAAGHRQGLGSRRAVVKARVVRASRRPSSLGLHLRYLQREGVTQDGQRGQMFDATGPTDAQAFAERCAGDRHHFRFIVSPDDAERLADLKAYARELMTQAEGDLGTRLDWIAVDHWNTGHPHLHILVRGRAEDGADLVISRDYISHGLRARAGALVELELGPRTEADIAARLAQQVDADRWTDLDRSLLRQARGGVIDLRPARGVTPSDADQLAVARLRRLEGLGLATGEGVGRWRIAPEAEATLRALGRERDIIARLHAAMTAAGRSLDPAAVVLDSPAVLGRLTARGHDDELRGSAFAVVEGVDGRAHHLGLRDLADASDAALGAVVELKRLPHGRQLLTVRSDLDLAAQVNAAGATWLDRRLLAGGADDLADAGFGLEVRAALASRANHLAAEGLARRQAGRWVFARNLLATLQARELAAAGETLAQETGLTWGNPVPGEAVSGVLRRRVDLASGRFAMVEGALGFALVPWRPDLEARRGLQVQGEMAEGGRMTWSLGRARGLEI
jgi:type IV secretory pathway VirD2 relaxase